jgi:hypothetical protein
MERTPFGWAGGHNARNTRPRNHQNAPPLLVRRSRESPKLQSQVMALRFKSPLSQLEPFAERLKQPFAQNPPVRLAKRKNNSCNEPE